MATNIIQNMVSNDLLSECYEALEMFENELKNNTPLNNYSVYSLLKSLYSDSKNIEQTDLDILILFEQFNILLNQNDNHKIYTTLYDIRYTFVIELLDKRITNLTTMKESYIKELSENQEQ